MQNAFQFWNFPQLLAMFSQAGRRSGFHCILKWAKRWCGGGGGEGGAGRDKRPPMPNTAHICSQQRNNICSPASYISQMHFICVFYAVCMRCGLLFLEFSKLILKTHMQTAYICEKRHARKQKASRKNKQQNAKSKQKQTTHVKTSEQRTTSKQKAN